MSMPRDHIAADPAGHGRPGASHAGREQVIEVLKTAFVQGRLTKDEFGTRIGQAFTSRLCGADQGHRRPSGRADGSSATRECLTSLFHCIMMKRNGGTGRMP